MRKPFIFAVAAVVGAAALFAFEQTRRSQADTGQETYAIGLVNQVPPVGTILPFAGDVSSPEIRQMLERGGWRVCDGGDYDPERYKLLKQVIGTRYAPDERKETKEEAFKLPDLRGEFLRGADDMGSDRPARGIDPGRAVGSPQNDAVQEHYHTVDTLHNHAVHVFTVHGDAPKLGYEYTTNNSLIAGYPYGYESTQDGHVDKSRPQPAPYQHPGTTKDAADNPKDPRSPGTSAEGSRESKSSGCVGLSNEIRSAGETRPKNVAVSYIIKVL